MLFTIIYHWKPDATRAETRRLRQTFLAWQAPDGLNILAHYFFAGGGGIVIAEVDDARVIWQALSPFTPLLQVQIEPVLSVLDAVALSMDADEWLAKAA